VVDAGSGATALAARLWAEAQLVIVVTTPDMVSMMDAYATIKQLHAAREGLEIRVLVNQGRGDAFDIQVEQRIIQACRRFLGLNVKNLPAVPADPQISQPGWGAAGGNPSRPAAARIQAIAGEVARLASTAPLRAILGPVAAAV
jgi:MinD-like ATPase involved in chromosome partitioning or flagellar assembly